MSEAEHVLSVQNELGEGPVWSAAEQALYWVDIKQSRLYRYQPSSGKHVVYQLTQAIMALAVRSKGGLVTACANGYAFWDAKTERFTPIGDPESDKPQTRFNDGGVDPRGRFWAGTMNEADSASADGSLYRLDPDLTIHHMERNITVSNGIAWTTDQRTMYFTDSMRYTINAYDYDAATGAISNRRVFATIPSEEGIPDGLTIDTQGGVWSALFYGGKVIRFDPSGKREREIRLPVPNATSCAFGGQNLDELYITSAWLGIDEKRRGDFPLAGDLFRWKGEFQGVAEPLFAG